MNSSAGHASPPPVRMERFEGPLDLLLDEVRRQNVPVEKIAMAPIVSRFLEYVRTAAERNLTLDMEWLHMAATLIHWKSRSLLPSGTAGETAEDPLRDDLVQQLLVHRRQVAEDLARRRLAEQHHFSRPGEAGRELTGNREPQESSVTAWDLIQQARELARWVQEHRRTLRERAPFTIEDDSVTDAEMMDYLGQRLEQTGPVLDGATLIHEQPTPSRKSSLFLGMLELVRNSALEIDQPEPFGAIWIARPSTPSRSARSPLKE